MKPRVLFVIACLVATVFAAIAGAEPGSVKFSGHDSSTTKDFEVRAPWLLDWQVKSEFPELATFVLRLEDAASGQLLGIVTDFAGTGRGLKLFRKSGSFRLETIGQNADWSVEITEISEAWADRLEHMPKAADQERRRAAMSEKQVSVNSFSGWRAKNDQTLILIGAGEVGFRISFGAGGCPGLAAAKTISFVTPDKGALSVYDSILLEDGTRCYFDQVTLNPQ